MALHTLKELHDRTADQIREPDKFKGPYTDNIFKAFLVKDDYIIELYSHKKDDTFVKCFIIKNETFHGFDRTECFHYYKVHDNIYADTKLEADNERVKWYAECLNVNKNSKNPIQDFADMLAKHISKCFKESNNDNN